MSLTADYFRLKPRTPPAPAATADGKPFTVIKDGGDEYVGRVVHAATGRQSREGH